MVGVAFEMETQNVGDDMVAVPGGWLAALVAAVREFLPEQTIVLM
jgi:hypothetical protein